MTYSLGFALTYVSRNIREKKGVDKVRQNLVNGQIWVMDNMVSLYRSFNFGG